MEEASSVIMLIHNHSHTTGQRRRPLILFVIPNESKWQGFICSLARADTVVVSIQVWSRRFGSTYRLGINMKLL